MEIDKALVQRLAQLSKLEYDEKSSEKLIEDLKRILMFFEKINELPTEGVQPLVYMNEHKNTLREDAIKRLNTKEESLRNAPKQDGNYILVPKVIGQKQIK